mmetsp:Transcript_10186/g.21261  ORF Transcript_10186/g.21261 Transcript_10186/m.21261 type:complete len:86 (-) Transcript_10186:48-305(-)
MTWKMDSPIDEAGLLNFRHKKIESALYAQRKNMNQPVDIYFRTIGDDGGVHRGHDHGGDGRASHVPHSDDGSAGCWQHTPVSPTL